MGTIETIQYCLQQLTRKGADKSSCFLHTSKKQELNIHAGEISLFRTTYDKNLAITAIKNSKKGTIGINKFDKGDLDEAIEKVIDMADSSQSDEANDISPLIENKKFTKGNPNCDKELMYRRLVDFNQTVKKLYPRIILEEVILDHDVSEYIFLNSNGVDLRSEHSAYTFTPMFTAREGKQSSSFNYTQYSSLDLNNPLLEVCNLDLLLKQSSEQVTSRMLSSKFSGDLIISPDCLAEIIEYITSYLHDYLLIAGTSIYKDKLGQKIASEILTLKSSPASPDFADGYHITPDGFEAGNALLIDKGVLKSFLLSQYGANKTGLPQGISRGSCYSIDPGDSGYDEMVASVSRGIVLCRFSGGNPNDKGDFSGVAKNSYYIENGKIMYPVTETMISGNLNAMINNIRNISRETVDFGWQKMPWIQFGGIDINGK